MNKIQSAAPDRLFLVEKLPDPLTPASEHLQLFDNYIANTRMRVRQIRDPLTKAWTRVLQQRITDLSEGAAAQRYAELELNEQEYAVFERFEEREIRKNRYFLELEGVRYVFDIYLGSVWGVNTARLRFTAPEVATTFQAPPHAVREISNDPFFVGDNLVTQDLSSIREHLAGDLA
jgi:CYTH domain-containing protein